ncbi:MAG: ribbon-helix-helix domain-containing protein [Spirochaetota bacterium]
MPTQQRKEEVITFKVDERLAEALAGVGNRSAFIRDAILAALGNTCPVCRGTGILSVAQQAHWDDFTLHHRVEQCDDCHEPHLVCEHEPSQEGL